VSTLEKRPLDEALHDVLLDLAGISAQLAELVEIVSGEAVVVPVTVKITAVNNPWQWKSEGGMFHSLKVDNPTAAVVGVSFRGSVGSAGNLAADELVPAHAGRVFVRPFDVVEIGFDPAAVPAGTSTLYVTLYARQLQPAAYAFV
jgi:hypothetical protein